MATVISGSTGIDKVDPAADVYSAARTFTGPQRGAVLTDNDLSFDMNAAQNFYCTPTANGTLAFTSIVAGQSGNILFINTANYAIGKSSYIKASGGFLSQISYTGSYWISYYSNDGVNVYVTTSGALS